MKSPKTISLTNVSPRVADEKPTGVADNEKPKGAVLVVPASFIFKALHHMEELKGFLLYGMFFLLYLILGTYRIDWTFGAETNGLLELAEENVNITDFLARDQFQMHLQYLNTDLDALTTELARTCVECKVAVTDQSQDLSDLTMDEFVCSDFLSTEGSNSYPARDCVAEDAAYAERPDPLSAPCCMNQTLVRASMAAMTWGQPGFAPEFLEPDFLSPGNVSLRDLLDIDLMFQAGLPDFGRPTMSSDKIEIFRRVLSIYQIPPDRPAGTFLYVLNSVDTFGSALAQLIVARGSRMVGHELGVEWVNKSNSPGYVTPSQKIWTFNFEVDQGNNLWVAFKYVLWVFWAISLIHELLVFYENCLTCWELRDALLTPYTFFLFIPSTILPVFLELFKVNLAISDFILAVSCMQILFATRTIQEGKVLTPFTLIVLTIINASAQLVYLLIVVSIFTLVLICSYGQMFAAVDSSMNVGLSSTSGLERVFTLLTGPPDITDEHYAQTMWGSLFLYFVCVFSMFMTFASLIIATISDAFAESVSTMKESTPTPLGYIVRKNRSLRRCDFFSYMLCWRVWGVWSPGLYRKLTALARSPDGWGIPVEDSAGGRDVLFTEAALADVFGPATASHIISLYAVEKVDDEIKGHGATDDMLKELLSEIKELKQMIHDNSILSSVATSGSKALLTPKSIASEREASPKAKPGAYPGEMGLLQ